MNPVLSISSPGFQKSSPGFVKHESGFFSSPGPGFSRVRIFFESESGSESESGPGFEVCPSENLKKSFCYDGAKLWNSLPADMRDSLPPLQALFRANLRAVQICWPLLET